MLSHEAVNASLCVLTTLIQSLTGPAKACSYIAFHTEPDSTETWNTALATLVNDKEKSFKKRQSFMGFQKAPAILVSTCLY